MTLFREQEVHFGVFLTTFAHFWSSPLHFTHFSPIFTPLEARRAYKMALLPPNFLVWILLNMVKWACISILKGSQLLPFGHFFSFLVTFSDFDQF